ncbi:acetate--CoA ligase family protein [Streptomyces sp. NPDC048409]|uniref:acetate--CoA ligase family protein n=1 Tax=Streptomyces sp. NPDC048409 TaxID=3154723 RepID=UPI00342D3095
MAVVGASADPAKWGYWLARGALEGRSRRAVHLVNRRGADILGEPSATCLSDLPQVPDLVAFCVPASEAQAVIDEALRLGVRGLVGITAGLHGDAAPAARVRAAGARMIGPGSLGLFDAESSLHLAWGDFTPGELAVISQSGQIGSEIALLARRSGLGLSRFVSVGGQVDVTTAELLEDLVGHARTRAVGLYLEGFEDGRRVFAAVRALRAAGKHVVLLTAGTSEAGARAARSHTSALTSPTDLVDAACRAAGALRVDTPAALVDTVACLLAGGLPAGRRTGIVSDSGGQGALAADCASRRGLLVPELSPRTAAALAADLPATAATGNPVDLAGAGEHDLTSYRDTVLALLRSGEVDSVLLTGYFGRYGLDTPALAAAEQAVARDLALAAREHGRPLVVHTMGAEGETARQLRAAGTAVFATVEAAVDALAGTVALRMCPGRPPLPSGAGGLPAVPAGYWAARTVLAAAGVAFPAAREVRVPADVTAATAQLRAPYVLKAGWIAHKTEAGAVRVGLRDAAQALAAFTEMHGRLGEGAYVLEEQDLRPGAVEMIVGGRRDPGLGPMVTVGAGGTEAEVRRDCVTECAPVDVGTARAMIAALRCAPLLTGWRGGPVADVEALAETVAALSRATARLTVDGAEIEINPVRVAADGALAVDALMLTSDRAAGAVAEANAGTGSGPATETAAGTESRVSTETESGASTGTTRNKEEA